jgi:hypothetical protein
MPAKLEVLNKVRRGAYESRTISARTRGASQCCTTGWVDARGIRTARHIGIYRSALRPAQENGCGSFDAGEEEQIMSTFAVFGMTRAAAREIAKKKTPTVVNNTLIPESEWLQRIEDAADSIMRGKRTKQLSAAFDAPQYADEFLCIARRMEMNRDLQVKAKQVVKDASGKPVYSKRGKVPRKAWLPYFGQCA